MVEFPLSLLEHGRIVIEIGCEGLSLGSVHI